ncbi:unnamed protein product [Toxocara canis]|uniref:G protein-coupled receptor n=1 Tax=Toxocara canis TaxID=6265 RepID=A0A183V9S0_TOXCA|nr:unnamed protein product [Toxocara canis]
MYEIIPVLFILSSFLILAIVGIVGNFIIVYITALSKYNRFSRSPYIVLMLIPPAAYSAILLFFAVFEVHVEPTEPVLCIIVAIYLGFSAIVFTASDLLINMFVIIVYFLMWLKLRSKRSTGSDKLLKPLIIIGFFAAFNWALSTGAMMGTSYAMHLTEMQEYSLKLLAGVSINIEMAFSFPIFYVLRRVH